MVFGIDDALAGAVAGPILGGIGSAIFGSHGPSTEEIAAANAAKSALANLQGAIPSIASQELHPELYGAMPTLAARQEATTEVGPSAYTSISSDPRLREAQLTALSTLQDRAKGGMSLADKVAIENIRRQAEADQQAQQAAVMQNLAQRGMGGSGAELASRLAATQAAANRSSQQGMQQAATAQQNALQALLGSGTMGGQIREQDFGEAAKKAEAEDVMKRYDVGLRQGVQQRNVDRGSSTDLTNWTAERARQMGNVDIGNKAQQYNKGLIGEDYARKAGIAGAEVGLAQKQQQQAEEERSAKNQGVANLFGGIGKGLGGYLTNKSSSQPAQFDPEAGGLLEREKKMKEQGYYTL